ncbi:MAG: tRNA lysidine(34) synthetase TilS [Candidatus Moranbacteria bacterium]|nr:tRNA lysidine(34) synthetase TilS [Candidatus Moranbacteria bacterium]
MKQVQNFVAIHNLWQPRERFIVAVSGGPDSLCLLDLLFLLSQKYDFSLHIAHVNYALRGADSDLDEARVREAAHIYNLPITVFHPPKISTANLEEKLRDIRYQFFEKLRLQEKYTLIAVAHHQDDQAETFLLRLLRGSGMAGLSAMRPKNNSIVRPLLSTRREDILQYLKERHLSYRTDASNTNPQFLRNRLRNTLIPFIEKEYQPKIKKMLADTATLLASDYAFLETLVPLSILSKNNTSQFSVATLLRLGEPVLRMKLRQILKSYYQKKSPPKGLIDEILKLLKSPKSKKQTLTIRGLKIERKGDTVTLLDFQL